MRIVAFSYACEPGRGSEPGAGWAWARLLSEMGETWTITRAIYRPAIEAALAETKNAEWYRFEYVELPRWAGFWQRGERGLRLYYPLWQMLAVRRARALHREVGFSVAWHVTWANAWMGSLASLTGLPFIYGPISGGVGPPWRLARVLGARGVAFEIFRATARWVGRYLNPMARLAWSRAALILVNNPETLRWLPRRHRRKARVFQNVVVDDVPSSRSRGGAASPTALFGGRLIPWKGAALAVEAMARLPEWNLLLAGAGKDEARLKRLAHSRGVAERVRFLGWLPRAELLELMRESADVFVFPSLHDEGGWALAEAMANGLPVVCLDRGGPAVLAADRGVVVPVSQGKERVVAALAEACRRAVAAGPDDEVTARANAPSHSLERRRARLAAVVRDAFPNGL